MSVINWNSLFGEGFSICFQTHEQWCGEMDKLLGPGRCRAVDLSGHTVFDVYLKGGPYGDGHWALLDHDTATVAFTPDGKRLMSLAEAGKDEQLCERPYSLSPRRQHGWLPASLYPGDIGAGAVQQFGRPSVSAGGSPSGL